MKKRILTGLLLGLIAGGIDLIPMFLQKLSWDANLSALSLWLVSGVLTASVDWKVNQAAKGIMHLPAGAAALSRTDWRQRAVEPGSHRSHDPDPGRSAGIFHCTTKQAPKVMHIAYFKMQIAEL